MNSLIKVMFVQQLRKYERSIKVFMQSFLLENFNHSNCVHKEV